MSFTRIVTGCGLLAVAGFPAAFAQERAAASALGTQMTWSALADQVKAASNRVTILDDQMKKSIICNKRFMAYAPGAAGADGDGCIENQLIKQLAKRMDDLDKAVADINTRLTSVEGKVTKIEGDIATLTKKMADLTKRMDIAEADITKLEERMKTVEGKVAALDTALKTEVADRKAGDKTLDARITKEVDDINKDIAALEKELKARIVSVESEVDLILKCGRSGMVYNDKTKKCLAAGESRWRSEGMASNSSTSSVVVETALSADFPGIKNCITYYGAPAVQDSLNTYVTAENLSQFIPIAEGNVNIDPIAGRKCSVPGSFCGYSALRITGAGSFSKAFTKFAVYKCD